MAICDDVRRSPVKGVDSDEDGKERVWGKPESIEVAGLVARVWGQSEGCRSVDPDTGGTGNENRGFPALQPAVRPKVASTGYLDFLPIVDSGWRMDRLQWLWI